MVVHVAILALGARPTLLEVDSDEDRDLKGKAHALVDLAYRVAAKPTPPRCQDLETAAEAWIDARKDPAPEELERRRVRDERRMVEEDRAKHAAIKDLKVTRDELRGNYDR
jgi:hypothetical protein